MKRLILLLAFFPLVSAAQETASFVLKGTIQTVSYHLGGVAPMEDIFEPKPYPTTIYIVEYIDSMTPSKYITELSSDFQGNFEIVLPAGNYGFVTTAELNILQPGQVLPIAYHSDSGHISSHSY